MLPIVVDSVGLKIRWAYAPREFKSHSMQLEPKSSKTYKNKFLMSLFLYTHKTTINEFLIKIDLFFYQNSINKNNNVYL